jgi:hypothetical protein
MLKIFLRRQGLVTKDMRLRSHASADALKWKHDLRLRGRFLRRIVNFRKVSPRRPIPFEAPVTGSA